ncbi:MAG: ATP-binding protein [Rickettsiales bacterium]
MRIKDIMPKSFLTRMIIIIAIPMVISQIISTIIFYQRHWDSMEDKLLDSLVSEISYINLLYKTNNIKSDHILKKHPSIVIKVSNRHLTLTDNIHKTKLKNVLLELREKLNNNIQQKVQVSYSPKFKQIVVDVAHKDFDIIFFFSRKKIYSVSVSLFTYWSIGSSIVLLLITIIFAKNQIRSISNLSSVAEKIGKGQKNITFKPQGAKEIRNAWHALRIMHHRVEKQIKQRTELLAGVSHDLKTPITRMKLHLELLDDKEKQHLLEDLKQMENIVSEYLDFAYSEETVKTKFVDLSSLLQKIITPYKKQFSNITYSIDRKIYANIRENQISRAIVNFIDNSIKFSTKIAISLKGSKNCAIIEIHDNGPGISKSEMNKVLEPFYRVENSRNKDSGGIGLGMSIANDIISRHGGKLRLSNSNLGGLLVQIELPF